MGSPRTMQKKLLKDTICFVKVNQDVVKVEIVYLKNHIVVITNFVGTNLVSPLAFNS
jgi:hypothetical protein